jgi:ethanolamine ammonia-lyase large subunit
MDHTFTCLHCQEPFVVAHHEFNCRILRHGVFRHNLQPIHPHSSKDECDKLVSDGVIYGCGKPLQIVDSSGGGYQVIICDYI